MAKKKQKTLTFSRTKLKELRSELGSQRAVSMMDGFPLSLACLTHWESGRREPKLNPLLALLGWMKVDIKEVLEPA